MELVKTDEVEVMNCPYQPELDALTGSVRLLAGKVDRLLELHRWIIRWLLIVVCVIALGRSALDIAKEWLAQNDVPQSAFAEE